MSHFVLTNFISQHFPKFFDEYFSEILSHDDFTRNSNFVSVSKFNSNLVLGVKINNGEMAQHFSVLGVQIHNCKKDLENS